MTNEYQAQYINVRNGSCNYQSYDKINAGDTIHVVVTANTGYYFPSAPTFTINSNPLQQVKMQTNQTGNYITQYYYDYEVIANFSISITNTAVKPTTYKFTLDLDNATTNITATAEYAKDDSVYIEVTADEGFYFAEAPFLRYFELGVPMTVELAPVGGSAYPTQYQTTYMMKGATTLTAEAVVMPSVDKHSFTVNLENATCNVVNGAEYDEGTSVHIEVESNSGYYFSEAPKVVYYDLGAPVTTTMTAETAGDYPTKYSCDYVINADSTITANAVVAPVMRTLTVNVDNATCNVSNGAQYADESSVYVKVTANEGYHFDTAPRLMYLEMGVPQYINMDSVSGNTEYEKTFTITANTTLTANAVENPETFKFDITVTNATCNVSSDTDYPVTETVHVTITANEGYYFTTAPKIQQYQLGVWVDMPFNTDDTGDYKKNYYLDYVPTATAKDHDPKIIADGQVIPNVDKYGIITMYNPTATELKEIGDTRYLVASETPSYIDLGQYISSLKKLFINIPQGNKAVVMLGGYSTGVQSNVIVDDVIETDCGEITITPKYNNVMDYKYTKVELYLPFVGFVDVDTEKVMNQTLRLIYKTNVINGDSLACLFTVNDNVERLIYTFDCNVSFEIPYIMVDTIKESKVDIDANYLYGFTPFARVSVNKPYNTATTLANDDRVTTLATLTGFVKCNEVFNTIQATTAERNEIDSLLKSGVLV